MGRKRRHGRRANGGGGFSGGLAVWLPVALLIALLGSVALVAWGVRHTSREAAAAVPAIVSATRDSPTAAFGSALVGRWLRPDGGYVLGIRSVGEGGEVAADYANPRPVKVATARAQSKAGELSLYVELRDRGYPGNYYTLTYNAKDDELSGVYHHLGIGQEFDVSFKRLGKEAIARE